jgi:hypothetical protein
MTVQEPQSNGPSGVRLNRTHADGDEASVSRAS